MQFGELEDHFDYLGFVVTAEAPVSSPTKNSFAALEDQVRANRVLRSVKALVIRFLLRQEHYCSVILERTGRSVAILLYSVDDVSPHVRRIVPVQVNDLLLLRLASLLTVSVCFGPQSTHFRAA